MRAEFLVVRAVIPSTEDPAIHVVDDKGLYPESKDEIHTSQEIVFRRIGSQVLGDYNISIDRQMSRGNYDTADGCKINISNILADPVNPQSVRLADGYNWSRV